jgi:RNAse (barnase) inhibitor barstar
MTSCRFFFDAETVRPSVATDRVVTVPKGIVSRERLFDVLSEALAFPDYWGRNWDALNDMLTDLSWIEQYRIVLVHEDLPNLGASPTATYIDILRTTVDDWARSGLHQLVVLFPKAERSAIESLFSAHAEDQP